MSIKILRCYERSPIWPAAQYNHERSEFPSPNGMHRLIFHSPVEYAMGGYYYHITMEIAGQSVEYPKNQAVPGLYQRPHPMHTPWSFDSRFVFFSEAPTSWHLEDSGPSVGVDGRRWCADVNAILKGDPWRCHRYLSPVHVGCWSPVDYRVLQPHEAQHIVADPFGSFEATWRRLFHTSDTIYTWWDVQDTGWLKSGNVIWSVGSVDSTSTYIYFFNTRDGRVVHRHEIKLEDVQGVESSAGNAESRPQKIVIENDPNSVLAHAGMEPFEKRPAVMSRDHCEYGPVQRIHCRIGRYQLWLEVVETA